MELEEAKARFDQEIDKFLNRVAINHIVCVGPMHNDGKSWTQKECEAFLKESNFNKLSCRNIFLLNDHTNPETTLQPDEYKAINESLSQCTQFLTDEISEFCKDGENQYELNALIKKAFFLIDARVNKMNYASWLKDISVTNPENTFILLLGKKKIFKQKVFIDIETFCKHLIDYDFSYRRSVLYRLKYYLIDIYSEYLLLPSIEVNPKIKYDCTPTDIVELIYAISIAGVITDLDNLKAILMDMFEISGEFYSNAVYSILHRQKSKSVFVQKLSDQLNSLHSKPKKTREKK